MKNMGIIRDSFVIFKNWVDAINSLPNKYQLECYKALVEYGMSGKMPDGISPTSRAMLISFSVGMENNVRRYVASVENGKKGGRPKKIKNLEKPNKTQENLLEPNQAYTNLDEPTHNLYVNDNVNVNVNIKREEIKEERNLSLEKFRKAFPNMKIGVQSLDWSNDVDMDVLIEKINESEFLKNCGNIDLSWCLRHYDAIIQDKYKDFAKKSSVYRSREYTKEEMDSLFDSIDNLVG